jgi:predicted transcriptional regulator
MDLDGLPVKKRFRGYAAGKAIAMRSPQSVPDKPESKNSDNKGNGQDMAEKSENSKSTIPFMRAYEFILKISELTPAEKLVMIVVCRYWPNPYWDSNGEIARALNFGERYVEKIVKRLADMGIIKRGYAHTTKNGRPHTVRIIAPQCFSVKSKFKINWIQPEHTDGQQTEHIDGDSPNNRPFLPEQQADLLDKNRKINRKATPPPSPAKGQASALPKKKDASPASTFIKRKPHKPMSSAELARRKQKIREQAEIMKKSEKL